MKKLKHSSNLFCMKEKKHDKCNTQKCQDKVCEIIFKKG